MNLGPLASLPVWYWSVPYSGARFPGNAARAELRLGANCQLWAYELLAYFGFLLPDLRSDELWYDTETSARVGVPEPLDLVLYNGGDKPYGAHIGVWTGDAVAHLSRKVGQPTLWPQVEFEVRPRYSTRIGFKRPLVRSPQVLSGRGASLS